MNKVLAVRVLNLRNVDNLIADFQQLKPGVFFPATVIHEGAPFRLFVGFRSGVVLEGELRPREFLGHRRNMFTNLALQKQHGLASVDGIKGGLPPKIRDSVTSDPQTWLSQLNEITYRRENPEQDVSGKCFLRDFIIRFSDKFESSVECLKTRDGRDEIAAMVAEKLAQNPEHVPLQVVRDVLLKLGTLTPDKLVTYLDRILHEMPSMGRYRFATVLPHNEILLPAVSPTDRRVLTRPKYVLFSCLDQDAVSISVRLKSELCGEDGASLPFCLYLPESSRLVLLNDDFVTQVLEAFALAFKDPRNVNVGAFYRHVAEILIPTFIPPANQLDVQSYFEAQHLAYFVTQAIKRNMVIPKLSAFDPRLVLNVLTLLVPDIAALQDSPKNEFNNFFEARFLQSFSQLARESIATNDVLTVFKMESLLIQLNTPNQGVQRLLGEISPFLLDHLDQLSADAQSLLLKNILPNLLMNKIVSIVSDPKQTERYSTSTLVGCLETLSIGGSSYESWKACFTCDADVAVFVTRLITLSEHPRFNRLCVQVLSSLTTIQSSSGELIPICRDSVVSVLRQLAPVQQVCDFRVPVSDESQLEFKAALAEAMTLAVSGVDPVRVAADVARASAKLVYAQTKDPLFIQKVRDLVAYFILSVGLFNRDHGGEIRAELMKQSFYNLTLYLHRIPQVADLSSVLVRSLMVFPQPSIELGASYLWDKGIGVMHDLMASPNPVVFAKAQDLLVQTPPDRLVLPESVFFGLCLLGRLSVLSRRAPEVWGSQFLSLCSFYTSNQAVLMASFEPEGAGVCVGPLLVAAGEKFDSPETIQSLRSSVLKTLRVAKDIRYVESLVYFLCEHPLFSQDTEFKTELRGCLLTMIIPPRSLKPSFPDECVSQLLQLPQNTHGKEMVYAQFWSVFLNTPEFSSLIPFHLPKVREQFVIFYNSLTETKPDQLGVLIPLVSKLIQFQVLDMANGVVRTLVHDLFPIIEFGNPAHQQLLLQVVSRPDYINDPDMMGRFLYSLSNFFQRHNAPNLESSVKQALFPVFDRLVSAPGFIFSGYGDPVQFDTFVRFLSLVSGGDVRLEPRHFQFLKQVLLGTFRQNNFAKDAQLCLFLNFSERLMALFSNCDPPSSQGQVVAVLQRLEFFISCFPSMMTWVKFPEVLVEQIQRSIEQLAGIPGCFTPASTFLLVPHNANIRYSRRKCDKALLGLLDQIAKGLGMRDPVAEAALTKRVDRKRKPGEDD